MVPLETHSWRRIHLPVHNINQSNIIQFLKKKKKKKKKKEKEKRKQS
jgi:rRNA processing protein Krr1/Pno1